MRTTNNGRAYCLFLLIGLWISIITVLAACDNSHDKKANTPTKSDDPHHSLLQSRVVKISASLSVEPYVIKSANSGGLDSGFEVDIVREALVSEGYTAEFVYEPLKRTKISFEQNFVDGVMDVKESYPEVQGAFFSDEHMTYHNYVVTLRARKINFSTVVDLDGKKIVAFQQASLALGEEFMAMTARNPEYMEMASQENQISMLFLGRTDAIVLDRRIFEYHRSRLKNLNTEQAVDSHELFPPSTFRMAFKESKVRDAFNTGLKKLRASGRYQAIIDSYIKK